VSEKKSRENCKKIKFPFCSWNQLISATTAVNKKLTLFIGEKSSDKHTKFSHEGLYVFKQIKRLYHGITFNKVQFTNELYPFLRDQLKAVRKLVLYDTNISASTFRDIIKSATGLEELYIFYSSMPHRGKKAIERIPMPALKKLVANWQPYRFLEHIGETSVQDLQLDNNTISCEEFIQLQRSVEVLTIKNYNDRLLTYIAAAPFKLQKIKIAYSRWAYSSFIQSIVELLKAHSQTLKEIEFKGNFTTDEFTEPICIQILTRMRIETLLIESASNWQPGDLVQNNHLKKLVISSNPPSAIDAQRLFQAFPNIKDLEINGNTERELLVAMFSSLNLDRLVLSRISADEITDNRLKSLTLRGTALTNNVVQLNMPNLEELIIEEDFFVNQQLNLTCRLPNLRRLSLLTPRFKISKRFTMEIKFGCPLLDTLKVLNNPTAITEANDQKIRFCQLDPTPQQAKLRGDLLTMSFA
jgi:hypothetical protein